MILAAGRGERMRPLTDGCPKPLLPVGGKPLLVWHLQRLASAGFRQAIINHAHLGERIEAELGDGARWGIAIRYSPEPPGALETAGGIARALPWLSDPCLVINGDIYCDWDFRRARHALAAADLAHLLLSANPPQHPAGDFTLHDGRVGVPPVDSAAADTLTFCGIGIYRHALFADIYGDKPAKLAPLLRAAISQGRVSGERHDGRWEDVGTPQRLAALDRELSGADGDARHRR